MGRMNHQLPGFLVRQKNRTCLGLNPGPTFLQNHQQKPAQIRLPSDLPRQTEQRSVIHLLLLGCTHPFTLSQPQGLSERILCRIVPPCFPPSAFPTRPCGNPAPTPELSLPTFPTIPPTAPDSSSASSPPAPSFPLTVIPKPPNRSSSSRGNGSRETWNMVPAPFSTPQKTPSTARTALTKRSSASPGMTAPSPSNPRMRPPPPRAPSPRPTSPSGSAETQSPPAGSWIAPRACRSVQPDDCPHNPRRPTVPPEPFPWPAVF